MTNILVLDDNPAVLTSLQILFSLNSLPCITSEYPSYALELIRQGAVSLVIADMNFQRETTSGEEGKRFFYAARAINPDLPIILLTGWADLASAVELVKAGAADYLAKPWDDQKLLSAVNNLLELDEISLQHRALLAERATQREKLANNFDLAGVVYQSDAMHRLLSTAVHVAKADVPILITGPNGSGKEKIAEIIQRNSSIKNGPFIRLNAGAMPLDLMEAEMFGAEAGAYTGIKHTRVGHFEQAHGGTLFLDEIGNLPLSGQMKLLRLLQTGEFQRLGSSQIRRARVRIIAATNTDLPAAITQGKFREDLYYRLNVIELHTPALAERKDDILPLARHFLQGRPITPEALRTLEAYDWPGNVRELQNTIQRACLLASSHNIEAGDLQLPQQKIKNRPLFEPSEEQLRHCLVKTTSIAEAARQLGLSRQALYRRMEKYGINPDAYFVTNPENNLLQHGDGNFANFSTNSSASNSTDNSNNQSTRSCNKPDNDPVNRP
ncbi:MAG: sigma-54-dependent Fis family transcriptional regulator [Cellvibrio sp. 79]|nr:MAG: sigma-54-dependent Fis family transcriptional regulator [Cellvibrio sp. 79]